MEVPVTAVSLLKEMGEDTQSPRWDEFVRKYRPMMAGFLQRYFPTADAEEAITETLIALMDKLPGYRYDPDTKGHFRNYLIGILRYKACEQMKRYKREMTHREALEAKALLDWEYERQSYSVNLSDLQKDAYEMALAEFLADPSIPTRNREIFRRVALVGDSPEEVARLFGLSRNNVDQIKSRLVARLKEKALAYAAVFTRGA